MAKKMSHEDAAAVLDSVISGEKSAIRTSLYMNGKMSSLMVMIKAYMTKHGMNQRQFAEYSGVGYSTLHSYPHMSSIGAANFIRLANALGSSPRKLFDQLRHGAEAARNAIVEAPATQEAIADSYIVVSNWKPGLDLVVTQFELVPANQRTE